MRNIPKKKSSNGLSKYVLPKRFPVAMVWRRYDPEGLASTIFIIIIGNIHGLFFTLYLLLCLPAKKIYNWDDEDFVLALLSAFFPFATIWVEKKLAKKDRETD